MRILEFILLAVATVSPLLLLFTLKDHWKKIWLSSGVLIFMFHLLFEGYRWQMFPCYLLLMLGFLMIYKNWKLSVKGFLSIFYIGALCIFLILPAWLLPNLLPVFNLSEPTGFYQVGSRYLLVRTELDEIITDDPDDKRAFMVKVWYPATIGEEKKELYLDEGNRKGFTSKYGLPDFLLDYLDHIETNTFVNAEIHRGSYPVLIFSHGLYSEAFGYYALIEEIVSHGFIVMNINHTYESSGSLFPNGEVLLFNSEFDSKNNDSFMAEMAWNASQNYGNATNQEEQYLAVEELIRKYVGAEITERWSKDITALINYLEVLNRDSFLSNRLDLTKIGAIGHSQGGSAVGQVMLEDNRIKSGINLDGVQWGNMVDSTLVKPLLLISSDWPREHMDLNKFAYRNLSESIFQKIIIENSGHSSFMDIPLMVNIPLINEAGSIDPKKGYQEVTALIVKFFKETLN